MAESGVAGFEAGSWYGLLAPAATPRLIVERLNREGKTILFVTHDMAAVQRFCDRAVLLERGVVRLVGDPERVANHYTEVNFGRDRVSESESGGERFGSGQAEIVGGHHIVRIEELWERFGAQRFNLEAKSNRSLEAMTTYNPPNLTYPFGAYVCVVDIDPRTGETTVRRFVAVADAAPSAGQDAGLGWAYVGGAQGPLLLGQ